MIHCHKSNVWLRLVGPTFCFPRVSVFQASVSICLATALGWLPLPYLDLHQPRGDCFVPALASPCSPIFHCLGPCLCPKKSLTSLSPSRSYKFLIFKIAAILVFNGPGGAVGQCASSRQMAIQSVKPLQKCGKIWQFFKKMAIGNHLSSWLLKVWFLMTDRVHKVNVHHCVKFCHN